jgi:hypothetical protein
MLPGKRSHRHYLGYLRVRAQSPKFAVRKYVRVHSAKGHNQISPVPALAGKPLEAVYHAKTNCPSAQTTELAEL